MHNAKPFVGMVVEDAGGSRFSSNPALGVVGAAHDVELPEES